MKAIVCVDEGWGIGYKNQLLYRNPVDMKFFKEKTIGNVVVMGLNTLKSFPGGNPLKDRVNIVLCNDPEFSQEGVTIADSIESLFEILKRYDTNTVYIIGGASVYAQLVPYCDTVYVTKVEGKKEADAFFPNLDEDENWVCAKQTETQEHNELKFKFTTYKSI